MRDTLRALFGNLPFAARTTLVALLAAYFLWPPAKYIVSKLFVLANVPSSNTFSYDIGIGIATNLLSALIIGAGAYSWYRTSHRFRLNGRYTVEIKTPQEQLFGEVHLLVFPFSLSLYGVPAIMRLTDTTQSPPMKIEGLATIINNTYLIGHYAESTSSLRRRCGTVFYTIGGDGKTWAGSFTYIDPTTGNQSQGTAEWKKME